MSDNIDFQNEIREMLRGINQKIDLCNERIDTLHQDMAVLKSVAAMKSEKNVPCTAAVEPLDQEEKKKKESSGPSEVEHAQNNMENVPEKYLPETETKGLTFTVAIEPLDQEEKKDDNVTYECEPRADKEELSGPSEVEHVQNDVENMPENYLPGDETETKGLTFIVGIGPIDQEEKKKKESSGPSEVEHAQNNMENVPEKYLPETDTKGLTFIVGIGPIDQEEKKKKESSGPSEVEHAQNNMENVPEKYLPETETKGLTFTVAIEPLDQEKKKKESSGPSEVGHAQNNMEVPEKYLPETETNGLTFTVAIEPLDQEEKKDDNVTYECEPRADKEELSGPSEVEHVQNDVENMPGDETETKGLTFTVGIGPIDQEEKKDDNVTYECEPRADKEELSGPSEVEHAQNDVENMPENYLPGDETETKGPTFTVAIGPIDQEEKKEESVTSHKTPILAGCQITASGFMGTDMNVSSKESTIELDRKMVFRDVIVMFTGLNKAKRDELTSIVVKLGGKVCRTVKEDFTHLITEKCDPNSEKYDFARRLKLPVLRPSWLHAAVEANGFEELNAVLTHSIMNSHKTPLLGGCQITASGFMGTDRVKIGRLVELHGGLFTGQMSRATCTHLIAAASSGEKYRRAHEWGTVKVVTSEWLFKCDETGYRLREDQFLLNSDGEKRRSSADIEWNTTEGQQRNTTKDERKENMKPATKKMKVDMKLMKNEH